MSSQNRMRVIIRKAGFAAIFMCLGYFIAICCYRREIWIDRFTGELTTKVGVFPLFEEISHNGRAFEVYFGTMREHKKKPLLVRRESFFDISGTCAYTMGMSLLSAESYLVRSDMENGFSASERKRIAEEFHRRLREEGIFSAKGFAGDMLRYGRSDNPFFINPEP